VLKTRGLFTRIFLRALKSAALVCGFGLILVFPLFAQSPDVIVAISIVCFFAGGTAAFLENDRHRNIYFNPADAVVFGSALACGAVSASVPAAMAAVGRIMLSPKNYKLSDAVSEVLQAASIAAAAAYVFTLTGGAPSKILQPLSLPAAFAAAVAFGIIRNLLSPRKIHALSHAQSTSIGYLFAAAAVSFPYFVIFAPTLPAAIAIFAVASKTKREIQKTTEDQQTVEPVPQSEQITLIDQPTGLANKRYLDIFLKQEINRAMRNGQNLTVILIDIDNMRAISENAGEDDINRYLTGLGAAIASETREYDLVARYSYDVLAVVLPETNAQTGVEIARRLHKDFSKKVIPLRASFSAGIATYPEHGITAEDLISSAHHALNRAKFSGKDSVVSCHELAKAG